MHPLLFTETNPNTQPVIDYRQRGRTHIADLLALPGVDQEDVDEWLGSRLRHTFELRSRSSFDPQKLILWLQVNHSMIHLVIVRVPTDKWWLLLAITH